MFEPITFATDLIVSLITQAGPAGLLALFALMAVESFGIPPLPSEVILPVAGIVIATGLDPWFTWPSVVIVSVVGGLIGAIVGYEVGRSLGLTFIHRIGKSFGLEEKDLDRAQRFFDRRGPITVFVARMLPLVRAYISYPAGAAKMNRLRFQVYTVAGATPFTVALVYVGVLVGQAGLDNFRHQFLYLDILVGAAMVLVVVYYLWKLRERKARKAAQAESAAPASGEPPKPSSP